MNAACPQCGTDHLHAAVYVDADVGDRYEVTALGEEDETVIRSWIGQPLIRGFRSVDPGRADELLSTYLTWNRANTGGSFSVLLRL